MKKESPMTVFLKSNSKSHSMSTLCISLLFNSFFFSFFHKVFLLHADVLHFLTFVWDCL